MKTTARWGILLCLMLFGASAIPAAAQSDFQEIVVNFEDSVEPREIEAIAAAYGIQLQNNSVFSEPERLMRFAVSADANAETLVQLMTKLTDEATIEYAEPNYLYTAYFTPNDPLYEKQWNMPLIQMEEAWELANGKGAVVAVIDTGVAFENYQDRKGQYHVVPDLAQTKFVKGYDFIDDDEHANDDNGHGTHVAGTIAQSTNNGTGVSGIAYAAAIMPLKVLSRYGSGNIADIAEAIVFAADHGAHVINMSLGGPLESKVMGEAVEYATRKGVTIVCAAGNEGRNRASYPAAYPQAIGVASVGPDGNLAPYSNYGEGVQLAAPGGNTAVKREDGILQNTIGRMDPVKDSYEYFQGTSMASPHVAGVAALLVSTGMKDPKQIRETLLKTAAKKADRVKYGAGILNAAAAVRSAKGLTDEPLAASAPTISLPRLKESLLYFLGGIGFAILYFKLLQRGDGYGKLFSFLFSLAMFIASSGVFFVEYLPLSFLPSTLVQVVSSPFANLDRALLGYGAAAIHPLFHSALIPFVLVIALLANKWGRIFAIGFALGMASHLFIDAFFSFANVTYLPGGFFLDKAWLILNSLFCFGLAYLAGKE